MKNQKTIMHEQISLEQKRLKISGAILRAKEERLRTISDHFHFNNSDVLEMEFKEYQRLKKSFDKAYGVIPSLTVAEADSLMPRLAARHAVAQRCLELAEKREKEKLTNIRFFAIIARLFGTKKEPATPIIQQTKTR